MVDISIWPMTKWFEVPSNPIVFQFNLSNYDIHIQSKSFSISSVFFILEWTKYNLLSIIKSVYILFTILSRYLYDEILSPFWCPLLSSLIWDKPLIPHISYAWWMCALVQPSIGDKICPSIYIWMRELFVTKYIWISKEFINNMINKDDIWITRWYDTLHPIKYIVDLMGRPWHYLIVTSI